MRTYPALYDEESSSLHPLGEVDAFLVGRNESANLPILDQKCSRSHFRLVRENGRYFVEALAPTNPTHCNGRRVDRRTPLSHQDLLEAGQRRFRFLERPVADAVPPRRSAPARPAPAEILRTVVAPVGGQADLGVDTVVPSIPLAGHMLIGREASRVQIHLPHPQVSRVHAQLVLQGDTAVVRDLSSANGTYVNGARLKGAVRLRRNDQIDVGPYALVFTGAHLAPRSRSDNVELIAHQVRRMVKSRDTGLPLTLLDDVTVVIRPQEFVCLLGPTGSGKTTLMWALSGRAPADAGTVLLNGRDLYAHFEALKQDMAIVHQKDVLHESLSVGVALWYTARLRLPPDTSAAEARVCIDQILDTVGLTTRAATAIRHLSGGQVKRASLANEILCKPSLLFLDEVTSGLDEQTDRDMMNLFRTLADAGKTVVCITHSLANVERTCHLVVLLTEGGRLAFVGKPAEALEYFGVGRLGDVYEKLKQQSPDHWKAAFAASPLCARYVTSRLPAKVAPAPAARQAAPSPGKRLALFARQANLLTRRYLAIWLGDRLALLAMLGQSVVVALLLVALFGDLDQITRPAEIRGPDGRPVPQRDEYAEHSVSLLFLLAVSGFWFGCNNAAKEIVKERTLYTRERDFNLRADSYYASKFLLLLTFSGLQTLVLFEIVRRCCHPPGDAAGQAVLLLALSAAGTSLGLAISAAAKTEEMAITLVPLAIMPQIILSNVIAPVSGWSKTIAVAAVTTYWGKRGLDGLLPEDVAAAAGVQRQSTAAALAVLLLHTLVFVVAALVMLRLQERRKKGAAGSLFRRGNQVQSAATR